MNIKWFWSWCCTETAQVPSRGVEGASSCPPRDGAQRGGHEEGSGGCYRCSEKSNVAHRKTVITDDPATVKTTHWGKCTACLWMNSFFWSIATIKILIWCFEIGHSLVLSPQACHDLGPNIFHSYSIQTFVLCFCRNLQVMSAITNEVRTLNPQDQIFIAFRK